MRRVEHLLVGDSGGTRLLARLRGLDDRVLGRPKPPSPRAYRNGFAWSVLAVLALLLLAVLTGSTSFVVGTGGLLGVLIANAFRWWSTEQARRPVMRIGIACGLGAVLAASALTWATFGSWVDPATSPLPPRVREAEPTQLVQCDETPQGRGYAYQAPVSETPRCENGAEPRVLLRP
ncbi:MAG: hypothetical protein JWM62_930 [Frankiales bacterium]|nr:hypothetical protein [Frankiales bacterium]